jgi:hypothetical protein
MKTFQKWKYVQIRFNPLEPKLIYIIFKNSIRTTNKTQHFYVTKIIWLMLFTEIIPVFT